MRCVLFVSLVCTGYKSLSFGAVPQEIQFLLLLFCCFVFFFLDFESSIKVTGPCLQVKIPYVKQNCNFLGFALIVVRILMKHSGLSEEDY